MFYLLPNLKFSFLKYIDQSLYVPFRKSKSPSFSEENAGFPWRVNLKSLKWYITLKRYLFTESKNHAVLIRNIFNKFLGRNPIFKIELKQRKGKRKCADKVRWMLNTSYWCSSFLGGYCWCVHLFLSLKIFKFSHCPVLALYPQHTWSCGVFILFNPKS